mgnify:CR=1 FL=1
MRVESQDPLAAAAGRAKALRRQVEDLEGTDVRDTLVAALYAKAEDIYQNSVIEPQQRVDWDQKVDDILTSKVLGYPLMLLALGVILWISITAANYPSELLATSFFAIEKHLSAVFAKLNAPGWLHGFVVLGIYRSLGWVIAVMLPPMAIFFPLFGLLEDLGYLPRVAFNLDRLFQKAGAHGKQALTMAMGFGCNAAGVMAARIIDSPRERMLAILTNNFMPCNGRFPLLIAMASLFLSGGFARVNLIAALIVAAVVLFGVAITFLVSYILSRTLLRGVPSFFTLELPPYRRPQIMQILVRSLLDRTLPVLLRAVKVAAPAGGIVSRIGDFRRYGY